MKSVSKYTQSKQGSKDKLKNVSTTKPKHRKHKSEIQNYTFDKTQKSFYLRPTRTQHKLRSKLQKYLKTLSKLSDSSDFKMTLSTIDNQNNTFVTHLSKNRISHSPKNSRQNVSLFINF